MIQNGHIPKRSALKLLGFSIEIVVTITIFIVSVLTSCRKETLEPENFFYNYFPTVKGNYVCYEVDSIVHGTNDNGNDDSVYYYHYQVKDVIDTPFVDGEGIQRQVIVHYYREDSTEEWNINSVWSQSLTSASAYRWEENIPYHKLAFPVNYEIEWNRNDKNTLGEETYLYEGIHAHQVYNGIDFDSTITTLFDPGANAVEKILGQEVYAAGIGLIYVRQLNLRMNHNDIESGTEFFMTVTSYGKE